MYLENRIYYKETLEIGKDIRGVIGKVTTQETQSAVRKHQEERTVPNAIGTVKVKQRRAQGGCLGTKSRRRT
jgi:hypothetical protein